jgi:hypothetical protein
MSSIFDDLGNTDLSSVDTSYPVLVPDTYEFTITGIKKVEFKASTKMPNGGEGLQISATLNGPGKDTKGRDVNPGYQVTHMISLTPTEKMTADAIKANVARFLDAVLGRREWDPTFQIYLRQSFFAKTGVQEETTNPDTGEVYPAKTVIKQFVPKS